MRLGILGGTFDPIHVAHLRVAEEVREARALDRVLFVPSADPPHKQHFAAARDRLEMVERAIRSHSNFEAEPMEFARPGPSYTADTLAELADRHAEAELWFIVGTDQVRVLDTWSRPDQVLERANLAVVQRPGEKWAPLGELLPASLRGSFTAEDDATVERLRHASGSELRRVPITPLEVSSSELRAKIARGESVRYLIPDSVREWIEARGLYEETD